MNLQQDPPQLWNIFDSSLEIVVGSYAENTRRFIIQDVFKLTEDKNYNVEEIASSEIRIILLYCTQVNNLTQTRPRGLADCMQVTKVAISNCVSLFAYH